MRLLLQSTIYRGPSTIPFKVVMYKKDCDEYVVWYQQHKDDAPYEIGPRYQGSYCNNPGDALAAFAGRLAIHNLHIAPIEPIVAASQ